MLLVEAPCKCGSREFRFTAGLPSREKQDYRAMCYGCFRDLDWRWSEEPSEVLLAALDERKEDWLIPSRVR